MYFYGLHLLDGNSNGGVLILLYPLSLLIPKYIDMKKCLLGIKCGAILDADVVDAIFTVVLYDKGGTIQRVGCLITGCQIKMASRNRQ